MAPDVSTPYTEPSQNAVRKKYALDLFSGTHSVGKQLARRGYTVVSVDVRPRSEPTHCVNILDWDYKMYRRGYFEVIAASPPLYGVFPGQADGAATVRAGRCSNRADARDN